MSIGLRRPCAGLAVLALLALGLTVVAPAAVAAATDVTVNEVESNGGIPGDWIELSNTTTGAVSLAGYVVKDNDDTHVSTLPAGATIPAGGYYVVEESALGFGLGAADSARIFAPDGVTLLDSYSWTAHAPTTYGRCPNGTGGFRTTTTVTKGAANDCTVLVHVNEVESNGGTPGDWVELFNAGPVPADLSGWKVLDNDNSHTPSVLPPGSTMAAGGYLIVEEAALGFGLGAADSVRLFDPAGTLYESYSWTAHATTTYGRCPNGTGAFTTTNSSTKAAANDCGFPGRINEVESNGGVPGDWVELVNPSAAPLDIAGYVFRDNDDTHTYAIPGGTTIAAGGYFVLEEAAFVFGLGSADSARLFTPTGGLADSYTWTAHAATTYGRCPNATGAFTTTTSSTKGAANACPGDASFLPWPGGADVQTADGLNVFGGNLSGLDYEASGTAAPGVLWGARNGPGALFRLVLDGSIWTPDPANGWSAGKLVRYPDGTGNPDAEGVTFAGLGTSDGLFVSTERNNDVSGVSRNSVLRFDATAAGTSLTATHEWNLTADLPAVGPNLGLEAITWIPDSFLVSHGFFDEIKGHAYVPNEYPNHGSGLFFVGVEANGQIYAYALDQAGGAFTRIATIASGFIGVMDLQFDGDEGNLWAICDDGCLGRSAVLRIDATTGRFVVAQAYERPGTMPNLNNEGFAIAPQAECVGDRKPVFWADDSETGGHAIRRGTLACTTTPVSPPTAWSPGTVNVVDPDTSSLEGSIGHWVPWFSSAVSRTTDQAASGTHSLRIDITDPYGWGVQLNNWPGYPTTPGPKTVAFSAMSTGADLGITMTVYWRNAAANVLQTDQLTRTGLTSSFMPVAADLVAPAGTTTVDMVLSHGSGGPGDVIYVDDIAILASNAALDPDTSTLEGSLGQWSSGANSTVSRSTDQAVAGTHSLKVGVTGAGGWSVGLNSSPTGFPTTPGPKSIGFWASSSTTALGVTMTVSWRDGAGNLLAVDTVSVGPLAPYFQSGLANITAPPGTASVDVTLSHPSGGPGDVIYVDDIVVIGP